jgi:hypothetical protein
MAPDRDRRHAVFDITRVVIDASVSEFQEAYERNYGSLNPEYGRILSWAGRMALERISKTDAPYHDLQHTIVVTLVGQEILWGKHMCEGGVSPRDWLHFLISLLLHDIGYVRGICSADEGRSCTTGEGGRVMVPQGATDAFLTPHHVERGKLFVRERFGDHEIVDAEVVAANIDLTRFPVPESADSGDTTGYSGLVRAADLIGQLADPGRRQKLPALFREFEETGMAEKLGFKDASDLQRDYPNFFWNSVHPYIGDALRYLELTQVGRIWIAKLYGPVFAAEHGLEAN